MRFLIYENNINGHRLEYIHHLHDVVAFMPEHQFVFALPEAFLEKKQMFEWKNMDNVSYDFSVKQTFTEPGNGNPIYLLKNSYKKCKQLNFYIKKHDVQSVFVNTIIHYVPCLPFVISRGIKVSGILYNIYLRDEHKCRFISSLINNIKYKVMAKGRGFGRILVLNDMESADKLNELYDTTRFDFIPDPFIPIPIDKNIDIRKDFNIADSKILFAHFGGLQGRKGTIDILDSLELLSDAEKRNYVFFFAGKVYKDIEVQFKERVAKLQEAGCDIIFKEGFCSYEFLASLSKASNAILIPYRKTSQSSGLLGYASQFGTPVIAPSSGLIGQIVAKYELGVTLTKVTSSSLKEAYRCISEMKYKVPSVAYCEANSVAHFVQVIKSAFES